VNTWLNLPHFRHTRLPNRRPGQQHTVSPLPDCGYPSSILLKDGRILTVYYAVGSKDNPKWGIHCGAVTFEVPVKP
jgi:hypothetical protein